MALRPWAGAASITSRYGSHALARGDRDVPESVDTSAPLAGLAAPESVDTSPPLAGFAMPRSVDTSAPLAGFATSRRRRSARIGTPAARRYPLAVSRRTPSSASMRRSGHPSRPSASTCCRFSSLKTLAIPDDDSIVAVGVNALLATTGRFSAVHHWPVLTVP